MLSALCVPSHEGLPTFRGGRSHFGLEELGCAWEEGRRELPRRGAGAEETDAPWLSGQCSGRHRCDREGPAQDEETQ